VSRDFLEAVKEEQELLELSMKESFRQRAERLKDIRHITETEALQFVKEQNHKDRWHNDFDYWRKHLIALPWTQLKKFYKGRGNWLGYFDGKLVAVYWYNIKDDEIYDGFLVSSKPGAGMKLGRYLEKKIDWKINWSCCDFKYLKFNQRLGFELKGGTKLEGRDIFLLWRQKKY